MNSAGLHVETTLQICDKRKMPTCSVLRGIRAGCQNRRREGQGEGWSRDGGGISGVGRELLGSTVDDFEGEARCEGEGDDGGISGWGPSCMLCTDPLRPDQSFSEAANLLRANPITTKLNVYASQPNSVRLYPVRPRLSSADLVQAAEDGFEGKRSKVQMEGKGGGVQSSVQRGSKSARDLIHRCSLEEGCRDWRRQVRYHVVPPEQLQLRLGFSRFATATSSPRTAAPTLPKLKQLGSELLRDGVITIPQTRGRTVTRAAGQRRSHCPETQAAIWKQ